MSRVIRLNDESLRMLEEFKEICKHDEDVKNDDLLKKVIMENDNIMLQIALKYAIFSRKWIKPKSK